MTVETLTDMLEVLNQGKPIVFGTVVYRGFMDLTVADPVMKLPAARDFELGGHAMVILGYSLPKQQFLVKNSFGDDWGDQGYCWMPFEYVRLYVFEQWVYDISSQP